MLETLVVIALVATFVVLLVGIVVMLRGGEFNRKHGNTLMRLRVAMQALAVALLFVLFLLNRG
jgi:ABC-type dipeptide/oligopeptide/nickel transport system permease subunit